MIYLTGFYTGSNLGANSNGLNSRNSSTNYVWITGSGMAQGLDVKVTCGGISWEGTMGDYDVDQQSWPATLTCKNPATRDQTKRKVGDTQDVDVTVGGGNGLSSTTTFHNINVASVETSPIPE